MKAARLAALSLLAVVATPTSAACLSRTYLCFFDLGSAELSPRCQAIALDFVAEWQRRQLGEDRGRPPDGAPMPGRVPQVEVGSHADAAEAAAGKAISVSKARAEAIAALLRLNGVPADVVETFPLGARFPLVPATGDEPQNRRAELVAR